MNLLKIIQVFLLSIIFFQVTFANQHHKINSTKEIAILKKQAPALNEKVLRLAVTAYHKARKLGLDDKKILTIINYDLRSARPRLWVFNMVTKKLKFRALVAHGKNSGMYRVRRVSDRTNSLESSIGVFLTGKSYYGHDGLSLRLKGLDKGFNDNAYRRNIVMHGAWYVSQSFARRYDRLGRSYGCFAVSKKMIRPLVRSLKEGTLLFAYYPDQRWLENSRFLT